MRTLVCLALVAASLALFSGCAGYVCGVVKPGVGTLYSDYTAPLDVDSDPATMPAKEGTATTECILGLVLTGDAGLKTAAKNGEITRIHSADYHLKNILGIYSKFTTIVYGE